MKKRTKTTTKLNVDAIAQESATLNPVLRRFTTEVSHQLENLMEKKEVSLSVPLQARVKSQSSVLEKLERLKAQSIKVSELQDLVAFRIILQFRRDVPKTVELLTENFKIIEQYDTAERLKADQFGYSSIHLVVELQDSWLAVPTMTASVAFAQKFR